MSTLCLSDMGDLHDEWLREPEPASLAAPSPRGAPSPALVTPVLAAFIPEIEAAAA